MWFVYTYIMYGDSDNDECSTIECANAPLWMMLWKTFSALNFRQFYDDTKAPVKMLKIVWHFARFILKMSKYVASIWFRFQCDADFWNISVCYFVCYISIVMWNDTANAREWEIFMRFETFWEKWSLAIASGKIKQWMLCESNNNKKSNTEIPIPIFETLIARWKKPNDSMATKWC